jgi:RND superfamily putative drug exporter
MTVSAAMLIALAIPYFSIELGASGAGSLPEGTASARTFEILREEFEVGRLEPTEIVVVADAINAPEIQAGFTALAEAMASDADFGDPVRDVLSAEVAVISVPLQIDASSEQATSVIDRLRTQYVPEAFSGSGAEVLVGGAPGLYRDWFDLVNDFTPIVFVFVLGLSFLLLLVVFRSIVVPLKAIVMNLLSVGAAYGLMVLVFQEGVGAGVLGFQQVEAIEAWVPLFLFTVLFGLSMDYHVFLLSRIRERFDTTGDNEGSVAFGIRTTAGIITGAAAIMVVVFAGFALGDLVMFQQLGFGLAFAVFLDATIVRVVLVPATMRLLGRRNWYLPGWLRWLPDVRVEAGAHAHGRESDLHPATAGPPASTDRR